MTREQIARVVQVQRAAVIAAAKELTKPARGDKQRHRRFRVVVMALMAAEKAEQEARR
jgi:hypothetical protein